MFTFKKTIKLLVSVVCEWVVLCHICNTELRVQKTKMRESEISGRFVFLTGQDFKIKMKFERYISLFSEESWKYHTDFFKITNPRTNCTDWCNLSGLFLMGM